jgi:hypothetical protein
MKRGRGGRRGADRYRRVRRALRAARARAKRLTGTPKVRRFMYAAVVTQELQQARRAVGRLGS